jgi:sec-independent protein translocase protein TatB
MFDISWSELLILGVVALIVVGPKELPVLLRTLGKYAGMARKQASEFRSHFDDAMREAEMAELREEMEGVRRDILKSTGDVEKALAEAPRSAEAARGAAVARIGATATSAQGAEPAASAAPAEPAPEAPAAAPAASPPAKEA